MKNRLFALLLFVGLSTTLFGASARIKDFATTATSPASDDYFPIDGTTNGTRKILAETFLTNATTTGTGAVVFATSPTFPGNLTITGNATPSTTTAGTISFDTNAWASSRGSLQVYDGTANIILLGALASDAPTNGQVPVWNTGGTITWEDAAAGSGNVTSSGTPTSGQAAEFTTATNIVGVGVTGTGNYAKDTSPTFPGNLTITGNATPATTTAGTISFDTNAWAASRGSLQVYDGTANIILLGALASDTPSNGQVATWNTGGTITWETVSGSGNVTNNATLTDGNMTVGGGTTVISTSNVAWTAGNNTLTTPNLIVTGNQTIGNLTITDLTITGSITNASGTGNIVLTNSPTLITPALGTPSAIVLTSGTGLPISTGVSGLGTGVATALAINIGSNGSAVTSNATQTLTGKQQLVSGALGTDDTWEGQGVTGLTAGATIAQWEAVYVGGSSTYLLADANGSGTFPALGLAVAAYSSTDAAVIVRDGTVRNDAWAWTPGGTVYLSATAGALTQTAPSTTGDKVQVIGTALTADILLVHVSADYGTAP